MPDNVREAVFNLLRGHCEGEAVLDAFAGTGSIGLEAVSRGATRCVLIERDRRIARIIEQNIETLGVEDRCDLVIADALGPSAVARCPRPVHLIFMDPPYAIVRDEQGWERVRAQMTRLMAHLDETGYAILRTPWPFIREVGTSAHESSDQDGTMSSEGDEVLIDLERDGPEAVAAFNLAVARGEYSGEQGTRRAPRRHADTPAGAIGPETDGGEGSESQNPSGPKYEDIDLAIEGAIGPETHPYGSTAVHLYMRRPDESSVHPGVRVGDGPIDSPDPG